MPRTTVESRTATTVVIEGRERLAFAGCDYLGLSSHPALRSAAALAVEEYGVSAGASRETSGNLALHERLEERLADFLGTEAALVVADGYLADLALFCTLAERAKVALLDADAHPSLVDAARLAGLERYDYGSGDMTRAHALLDRFAGEGVILATDGVYSMHGRLAPANELLRHLPPDGTLVIDDSHGLGVLGDAGRGLLEVFGLSDDRIVVTASLSKALGAGGGVVAGSRERLERLRARAEPYVATTALAPPLAAAAWAALGVLEAEPERIERLHAMTGQLHRMARRLGHRSSGTFIPVLLLTATDWDAGLRVRDELLAEDLFVPYVRYPGAPDQGLFRIAVTSEHTAHDLRRLEEALERSSLT